jgi:hypothetical protein
MTSTNDQTNTRPADIKSKKRLGFKEWIELQKQLKQKENQ